MNSYTYTWHSQTTMFMQYFWTDTLTTVEKHALMNLWNVEYPIQLRYQHQREFEAYLANLSGLSHLLLKEEQDQVAGWYFQFIRDEEQWFGILIDSRFQRQGLGKEMLQAAMKRVGELNGWVADRNRDLKADGTTYISPLGFYQRLGFRLMEEHRLTNEKVDLVRIRWRRSISKSDHNAG